MRRFGALGRIHQPLALRSDNGLRFSSQLNGDGEGLQTHPGVHDALHAGSRMGSLSAFPVLEGGVHLATSVRVAGPSSIGHQPLGPVL